MLGANITEFQTKMRKVSSDLQKTGKQMKSMGKSMSMYVTAPLTIAGGMMIKAASDAQEVESKFKTVFSNISTQANQSMLELSKAYGYSNIAAQRALSDTGDLLTGFGFTQEKALELSTEVNKLAADLASFTNIEGGTERASEALTKALLGERESVKALGISILEKDVKERVALNRAKGMAFATLRQAKAFATLQLAQEQSKNAIGDYAKTQGSFANVSRDIKSNIEDLSASLGKVLLPIATKVAVKIKEFTSFLNKLSDKGKTTIVIIAGIAAAIGPLLIVFGTMATVLPTIATGFAMIAGPVGLVIAAIAGVAAAFIYVYGNWQAFKERLSNWGWLRNAAIDAFILLIKASSYFLNEIAKLFGIDFVSAVTNELEKLKSPIEGVETKFKTFGDTFKEVAGEAMDALGLMGEKGKEATNNIITGSNNAVTAVRRIKGQITPLKKAVIDLKNIADDKVELMPFVLNEENQSNVITTWGEKMKENWSSAVSSVQMSMAQGIADLAVTVGEALGNLISGIDPNFGQRVLEVVAGFIKNLGKALITYGSIMLAFTLLSSNPWTAAAAIVVGIAAIAAATVISNLSKKGVSGAKMASGGIVPGGFPNDTYPALLTSGEMVVPKPIPLSTGGGVGGGGVLRIQGTSRISGKDLLIVFDKAVNDRTSIRGY